MEVFELPFMTNSAEAGAQRRVGLPATSTRTKEFPGTKILAIWVHDEGYVHTRDKPIKTLADFKGLKMRAPTRQTNKLLASLGATPVGMPLPAVADAVSKGTIDGFLLPWEVMPVGQAARDGQVPQRDRPVAPGAVQRGVHLRDEPGQVRQPAGRPEEGHRQQQRRRAVAARSARSGTRARRAGRKAAVDRGNTFYMIPASELDNWVKAVAPLYDEWVADMDKRGLPGKQMLQDATRPAREVQEVRDAAV